MTNLGEQSGGERSVPNGFETWNAYWTAQAMPWRTQAEIGKGRKDFLAERRDNTNIPSGSVADTYLFTDIQLTRADVEWLLETHEGGGMKGPVDSFDSKQYYRDGLDLRGANLRNVDLSRLPLRGSPTCARS